MSPNDSSRNSVSICIIGILTALPMKNNNHEKNNFSNMAFLAHGTLTVRSVSKFRAECIIQCRKTSIKGPFLPVLLFSSFFVFSSAANFFPQNGFSRPGIVTNRFVSKFCVDPYHRYIHSSHGDPVRDNLYFYFDLGKNGSKNPPQVMPLRSPPLRRTCP